MPDKIALFRVWSSPPIARSVAQLLRDSFPEYELEIFDLSRLLKRRVDILLLNLWHILRYYGVDILLGRRNAKLCFWRTPYIFRQVKRMASQLLSKKPYVFSFQLQSLYDASREGIPHFIYTDHTHLANLDYPDFDPGGLYAPAWIESEKTVYRNATRIFTRSSNIRENIIQCYGCQPEKVVCVYAGSNIARLATPQQVGSAADSRHILFVGSDWERKGGPELVAAFERVQQVYPDASLTIVGCSPRIDLPNCQVVGLVPVSEVPSYYQRASVFCLPTKLEPFGVVFIEALAYGLPIVAADIGAIPDFVIEGENGHLVKPDDVEGLANALLDLMESSEKRRRFGEYSFNLGKARYSWVAVGKLIREAILRVILDGQRV